MKIAVKGVKPVPDVDLIARIERDVGYALPGDYIAFLSKFNGSEPESNIFQIPNVPNESGIDEFIEAANIPKEFELGGFQELTGMIPIAYAEGGNYVCLAVSGSELGAVFFWDHEVSNERQGLVKISDSIDGFLDLLNPFDPRQVKLRPGQIKSAWIDPSLLDDSE